MTITEKSFRGREQWEQWLEHGVFLPLFFFPLSFLLFFLLLLLLFFCFFFFFFGKFQILSCSGRGAGRTLQGLGTQIRAG